MANLVVGEKGCKVKQLMRIMVSRATFTEIVRHWKEIATMLEVPGKIQDDIEKLPINDGVTVMRRVLTGWKSTFGSRATLETLLSALQSENVNCVDAASAIISEFYPNNNSQTMYEGYKKINLDDQPALYKQCSQLFHRGTFGSRVALIKIFTDVESLQQAENEIKFLSQLDWHKNIIRYYIGDYVTYNQVHRHFSIVLDYQYNLCDYTKEKKADVILMSNSFCRQVINGVMFLHQNRVLHLNLKPENIFIGRPGFPPDNEEIPKRKTTLKIAEFCVAKQLTEMEHKITIDAVTLKKTGAGSFYTPEILNNWDNKITSCDVTCKTDIFCLGTVLYFILSGGEYALGKHSFLRHYNIMNQKDEVSVSYLPENWIAEFPKLFSTDPANRPDVSFSLVPVV